MQLKKKEIDFFKMHGWLRVKSFLNKNDTKSINNKINSFLKKNADKYTGRDINFVGNNKLISKINSFHKLHDLNFIKKFSRTKKISWNVKKLLGSKELELKASEYFAKPKKKGLYVPIHQDNFYWNIVDGNALTLWIALTKSEKKNGAVFYYDKSHKNGVFDHKPSYAKGSSQTIKNINQIKKFKKITPKLDVGDVIFHHSNIVHGSPSNKSPVSRKGFTLQLKDKNSKYDKKLIKKYEKSLLKQVKSREIK
tara:strand:+ start:244 stop:999 length:756 start_codon:yes stop_codon:yes gene_type:complete